MDVVLNTLEFWKNFHFNRRIFGVISVCLHVYSSVLQQTSNMGMFGNQAEKFDKTKCITHWKLEKWSVRLGVCGFGSSYTNFPTMVNYFMPNGILYCDIWNFISLDFESYPTWACCRQSVARWTLFLRISVDALALACVVQSFLIACYFDVWIVWIGNGYLNIFSIHV